MRYRIIRYLDYSQDEPKAVFECQRQKFFIIPLSRWETFKNNDREHKLMKFNSLRKAKEAITNYFLRDCCKDKSVFSSRKRYCQYIDYDFFEFTMPYI